MKSAISAVMSSGVDIESVRENLRRYMALRKVKPTTLSLALGQSKTLIKDLMENTTDIKLSTLVRIADFLSVDVSDILARPRVPIVGYVGAGGQIIYDDIGETLDPDNSVLHPPGVSGKLIALMVRGDSMLPRYRDGDVIYVQRNHDGVLAEYVGEDCAIRLCSGETYIKQLAYGSKPGLFTLMSLNAAPMADVEIEWATLVLFVLPAATRRLHELGSL